MSSKKSKEFRKRMEIKEKNKNNWKNKINPDASKVEFSHKENLEEELIIEEFIGKIDDVQDATELEEIAEDYNIEPSCGMTRNMFERKVAEIADGKRREEYQKVIYKKLEEQEDEYSR